MGRVIAKLIETRIRRGREILLEHWLAEGRDLPARDPEFKREILASLFKQGFKLPKQDVRELLCGETHTYSSTRWIVVRYYRISAW